MDDTNQVEGILEVGGVRGDKYDARNKRSVVPTFVVALAIAYVTTSLPAGDRE